ncbi:MAG: 5-formaminoimidazole-4-carboxamide-1-(beta)-D-ribofuranosyl 5'-monophosphate synthetase [Candidatus Methanolliviera sp. GoM_oil]|nr:MAG: 5-formaminoimidazole-4-carboxamide-1-(beta)-D-ribofuranosyl 5'-monophosphate synthetase [Candidatus Methanolliviera sp. GoM_oil]
MTEKIAREQIWKILDDYDTENLHIGVLGGHSALDVCNGAKKHGFKTLAVCREGREKTYTKYYKTRGDKGCIDETIVLKNFSDITKPEIVKRLQEMNTIFIHSRYFWVYFNFTEIETKFRVPIFGNRGLLKTEERDVRPNQYDFLKNADIRMPKQFSDPKDIDRLTIVKTSEAYRGYERAFFFASSYDDYVKKSKELLERNVFTEESLKNGVIEEYVLGAQVNFNYFYSSLNDELEIMGTDMRRQTNLDGLLRLPATQQIEVLNHTEPKYIETGHVTCTVKESLLEKGFDAGERFVKAVKNFPPGMIGPFALQGAITPGPPKEEFVVFDVSMRIPGSPGTMFTPYSGYLYGQSISCGDRIAMEIKRAVKTERLREVVT